MFLPFKDDNPLRVIPFEIVNVGLIAIATVVFVVFQSDVLFEQADDLIAFAMIPAAFTDMVERPSGLVAIPEQLTLITYIFLHGGWWHLVGNMAFLWVFGDNVEDAMGHLRYLAFFLLCGVAAGLAQTYITPQSQAPLIGASGAVAGVIGAYLILHPRVKVWVLVLWRIPLRIPVYLALGLWIALQFIGVLNEGPAEQVAWWAHLGGLAAGMALIPLFKRADVPLFNSGQSH